MFCYLFYDYNYETFTRNITTGIAVLRLLSSHLLLECHGRRREAAFRLILYARCDAGQTRLL